MPNEVEPWSTDLAGALYGSPPAAVTGPYHTKSLTDHTPSAADLLVQQALGQATADFLPITHQHSAHGGHPVPPNHLDQMLEPRRTFARERCRPRAAQAL